MTVFILPVLAAVIFLGTFPKALAGDKTSTRIVTDMIGRKVEIPAYPKKIACLDGPAYEKIFAFGASDRIALITNVTLPWDSVLNPDLKNIPSLSNFTSPDVEQLLNLGTDLVIFKPFDKPIQSMTAAGIPVVVAYNGSERRKSMADFIQDCYAQIRFYGSILGGDGPEIAEKYCAYVDGKIQKVLQVTGNIPAAERPKVFYYSGMANGPAGTQSKYTTAWWLVEAAGGTMMTYDDAAYFISVSTEQMILWDPEFIFVSTGMTVEDIMNNSQFRGVRAVKDGKVLPSPQGVFYWTHFSTESYLLVLYLARQFHTELFPDLDVTVELKDYYEKFYHYRLTDDEARRILNQLPPRSE